MSGADILLGTKSDGHAKEISVTDDGALQVAGTVTVDTSTLATAAKQDVEHADLAAILAKLSSDPATQTTLAAVLAKLSSDPATQTTLAAVLAKLSSDPSTAAKQDLAKAVLDAIDAELPAAAAASDADANPTTTIIRAATLFWDGSQWLRGLAGQLGAKASSVLARMLNVLATGQYNASGFTLTDGQGATLQLTSLGQLRVVVEQNPDYLSDWIPFNDPAPSSADLLVKNGPGRLGNIVFSNVSGSTIWLQAHNATAALSPGDKPLFEFNATSGSTGRADASGLKFGTGIRFGLSSTQRTYTASVATLSNTWVTAQYK